MVRTIELSKGSSVSDVLDTACSQLKEKYGPLYVQTDGSIDVPYGITRPSYYRVMHEHTLPQSVEVKRFLGLGRRTITHGRRELFRIDLGESQISTGLDDEVIAQACDAAARNPKPSEASSWAWDR